MATSMAAVAAGTSPAAADTPALGATSATAAASCWSIKQQAPASTDGIYWLLTQALGSPQQFYCDMTTNGGGWVLIGRGREGWGFGENGQGSPVTLRNTVTGPAAFSPAALDDTTINQLMDNGNAKDLTDGVLLRRAADQAGSTYQLVDWKLLNVGQWTWAMPGGNLLASESVDGVNYVGGNTQDSKNTMSGQVGPGTGNANDQTRVFTTFCSCHNTLAGFAYGQTVNGSTSSTSYLWTPGQSGQAVPFTQVLIRPHIMYAPGAFTPIPDAGLPAQTLPPIMSNVATDTNWGVTGVLTTNDSDPKVFTPVQAFAELDGRMFVGGKFAAVQNGPGGTQYPQSYLAAFDVNTGDWIPSFTPQLDGTVWDVLGTSDGKLIVAGQFSNVNGVPNTAGLAALDPMTGQVITTWQASIDFGTPQSVRPYARTLKESNGYIYVGGNFARITSTDGIPVPVARFARLSLATGAVDTTLRPNVDGGAVVDLFATSTRLYLAGYFTTVNGLPSDKIAVIDLSTGTLVPGLAPWQPTNSANYQQAIMEVGQNVFQGGSEHDFQIHDRDTYNVVQKYITNPGGDFQAVNTADGVVYASCHCNNFVYTGATAWSSLTNFTVADRISYVIAVDAVTGQMINTFQPLIHSQYTQGVWALYPDSNDCLWIGGDLDAGARVGNGQQWLGGFGKFCARDTVAPTTPTNVVVNAHAPGNQITWGPSTDNAAGNVSYEVLRNDRVISPLLPNTFLYNDTTGLPTDRYFVRAVDATGNRSATSPVALLTDTKKPTTPTGLAVTATGNPGEANASWNPSTDNVGVAGYNVYRNGALFTTVTAPATSVTLTGLAVGSNSIQVTAFDAANNESAKSGAVPVVIAGPDTTKPSIPTGLAVTATGNPGEANASWNASTDNIGVVSYNIYRNGVLFTNVAAPATSTTLTGLAAGSNSIQVSALDAANNESSKSAPVAVVVTGPDTTKPSIPTGLAVTATGNPGEANASWNASTDNVGVVSYNIYRNGVLYTNVLAPATSVTLAGLPIGTSNIQITALDAANNESSKSAPVAVVISGPDTTKPSIPTGLVVTATGNPGEANASWNASTDNVGVVSYNIYRSGVLYTNVPAPATSDTLAGLSVGSNSIQVSALDAANNESSKSAPVVVVISGPDTTKPSIPTGLAVTATGNPGEANASWNASTDNIGVASYNIYRNGVLYTNVLAPATSDTLAGLPVGTSNIQVSALDAASNESSKSAPVAVVISGPDTTKPSIPTGLTVTPTGNPGEANASWNPSTDNVGVAGYNIYRNGVLFATVLAPSTSTTLTGLPVGASSLQITAFDAAANESSKSAPVLVSL